MTAEPTTAPSARDFAPGDSVFYERDGGRVIATVLSTTWRRVLVRWLEGGRVRHASVRPYRLSPRRAGE
jgi:hypothetical protein